MKKLAYRAQSLKTMKFYESMEFFKQQVYLKAFPESLISTRYAERLDFYD